MKSKYRSVQINAYAKINLSFDILGLLPGGFHEVSTVMQTIPLCDKVTVSIGGTKPISLRISSRAIPANESNTAWKAAETVLRHHPQIQDNISIDIEKKIPLSGGLGGSSADAAGVILALNKIYGLGLDQQQLAQYGAEVGSDVPFLLMEEGRLHAGLATGTGTEVRPLPPLAAQGNGKIFILIANPKVPSETASVYREYDKTDIPQEMHPDTNAVIKALEKKDVFALASAMGNVLELPAFKLTPEIKHLKIACLNTRPIGAMMSGSGSSVFALYNSGDKAFSANAELRKQGYYSMFFQL